MFHDSRPIEVGDRIIDLNGEDLVITKVWNDICFVDTDKGGSFHFAELDSTGMPPGEYSLDKGV